ncbi:MAG: hypothetical protein CEN90_634 [Parcubacteria group bacterium Licking1014_17]|nr:MAG: hypothetical protein CEN90_634 [Parcubacteria group bacterium Licking1014_17]
MADINPIGGPAPTRPPQNNNINPPLPTPPPPVKNDMAADIASQIATSPKPATPPMGVQATGIPSGDNIKTTIRTMQEDVSALRKGSQPIGSSVDIKSAITPPPAPPTIAPKPPTSAPAPVIRTAPPINTISPAPIIVPPKLTVPGPVKPMPSSTIPVPPQQSPSKTLKIIIVAVIALILLGVIGYIIYKTVGGGGENATPTPTVSGNATPLTTESIFGIAKDITLPYTGDALSLLSSAIAAEQVAAGSINPYQIVGDTKGGVLYSFGEFLNRFSIDISALNDDALFSSTDWILGLYNQSDNGTFVGNRIVLVVKSSGDSDIQKTISDWAANMPSDFAGIFGYQTTGNSLNDDVYSGVPFKYIQVADKNLGFAVAAVSINSGDYLVIGSSKESFRLAVDTLLNYKGGTGGQ